ncbi:ABC transporter substrate-binding protein [Paenibacillus sp. IB182496]|uniref:ABC transporter substrate-binding protein n=1 Tax=Paenibacillus sabuli TaxID=2772509 RepID=A0A927GR47_9BACL|nr:ABC transporter substrate-binding protein [Paenibacillus sabuli]MBD2845073.1 ABC transporter substrate-binding protein [Paenibacillus sabuli]
MNRCITRSAGLLAAVALVGILVGCSAGAAGPEAPAGGIVIEDFAGRKLTFAQPPQRIAALGNGEVDIIYALGGTLVGRPEVEGVPRIEAAREVATVGSVHTVNMEKLAAVRPEVVLANHPINAADVPLIDNLGAEVILTSANSLDDIRRQIELFGQLLGRESRAEEVVAELDEALAAVGAAPGEAQRALLVYGAPGTYLAALPNSLAGNLLEQAGGRNVAADFPRLQSFPQYAQLGAERVVEADPDLILIMTHGDSEEVERGFVREMESNAAWNGLRAVKEGRIHVLPRALFGTNPGTKAADAVQLLAELLGA